MSFGDKLSWIKEFGMLKFHVWQAYLDKITMALKAQVKPIYVAVARMLFVVESLPRQ